MQEAIGDKKGVASSLNNLGVIYTNLGQILSAIDVYKRCLKIQEALNEKKIWVLPFTTLVTFINYRRSRKKFRVSRKKSCAL
ncbi:MAG: tetratricopeptide repeat protein [Sphingobacteriaceae bacterium]|nr:tetratricopeptide repeat protein [Sphingobacteriaceae bacterium]